VRRVFRVLKEDVGAKARADFGQLILPVILAAVKGGSAALAIMNKSPAAPAALLCCICFVCCLSYIKIFSTLRDARVQNSEFSHRHPLFFCSERSLNIPCYAAVLQRGRERKREREAIEAAPRGCCTVALF
jgi:hypothetical protein